MSTNCNIAIALANNKYKYVYCHWDGYPDGAGAILEANYTDADQVLALLALGDLSQLGKQLHPTDPSHSYETPQDGVCIFYHRDRDEDWKQVQPYVGTIADIIDQHYTYIFDDGEWSCYKYGAELEKI